MIGQRSDRKKNVLWEQLIGEDSDRYFYNVLIILTCPSSSTVAHVSLASLKLGASTFAYLAYVNESTLWFSKDFQCVSCCCIHE